jgi:RimJ/RimL family protein N-acetyltransferase
MIVEGSRVALGPVREDLAATYTRWVNDPEVRRGLATTSIYTVAAEEDWARRTAEAAAKHNPELAAFTIYDRSDLEPVGSCSLMHIDWRFRRAELGILLGERRGHGLGTEATMLTLDWAFTVMGLHNVLLGVFAWNAAAIRAYEKAGFREIGRRRGAAETMGRRFDEVLMDAVASEFESPVLGALVPE